MRFKHLSIHSWQQFANVDIEFSNRLTVLTGPNGSGKTTLLNLLARHYSWDSLQIGVPLASRRWGTDSWLQLGNTPDTHAGHRSIGTLEYESGTAELLIPKEQSGPTYQVQISGQQNVNCFFVPSHRSVFRYAQVANLQTNQMIAKSDAFSKVFNGSKQRYFGSNHQPTSFYIKETLLFWNIFGHGNDDMEPNPELLTYYKGFENLLKIVLPEELGFQKIAIRNLEVMLKCDLGDFIIDASSGGVSAIIDLAWQIFMHQSDKPSTIIIDEIENHLHPSMQRRILPDLLRAFPEACFIVSTHSPLVVSSVKEATIYALRPTSNFRGLITSDRLDMLDSPLLASEILNEVLGVESTMPIWAEEALKRILDEFTGEGRERNLSDLKLKLRSAGLQRLLPEAITSIASESETYD